MVPTIIAAVLDSAPLSKPSDMLGIAVMGGLFLFALWVCFVVGKNFEKFLKGIAWIIALAVVAIVLIAIFQAGYPGQ